MSVTHIVVFNFKPDASAVSVKQCCDEVIGLKDRCILASTSKPYIANSKGGKDISIEGMQNGFTHMFITEFSSVADRDYYVKKDKAHHDFIGKWITATDTIVANAMVMDFVAGSF
ncbi:uncharacterized protein TRIVIDRAFT_53297 [Trichoderma virens Gv29-8]|uniref:Stress-response A/B barrel domain-containing protein n=1 Tax=Hypocrea virens (strain Gv29-8 / FGSC 10586) TaxID=413071 RepID=G9MUT3_HYPVG|nr:uncharacterized protein TRIVIDRAFT_53297 [Trichoderma virens Gv29-8]EHK21793.1 hypothetical protein TRIVIDRAFT_53297 [Trichoderma virens Gv29-8]UKZ52884.1 hypothetical protein TrVGV298_006671 [Trichoderma virens]UKZ78720.1 hypothetical protein TrVFT333_006466 [Trichoderma virens FT-333]